MIIAFGSALTAKSTFSAKLGGQVMGSTPKRPSFPDATFRSEELRGIPIDPREVDEAGQGLSIYDESVSVRWHRFEWLRAAAVIAGATVLRVIGGK